MAGFPNHLSDPPQRPQFGAEAPGAGTAQQRGLQTLPGGGAQAGKADGAARLAVSEEDALLADKHVRKSG